MQPTILIKEPENVSICLLGAGFTTGNMGVAALASGTIASLYYSFPEAKIFILDYNKTPAKYNVFHPSGETSVELVNLRYTKKVFLPNSIIRLIATAVLALIIPGENRKRSLRHKNKYLSKMDKVTWVVSIAGGDSFSDIYGLSRLLYVTLPQLLLLLLRKPLIQLPQTYGPFNKAIAKMIARFILTRSNLVYTRDREGLSIVQELTKGRIQKSTKFAFDMGFAVISTPPPKDVVLKLEEMKKLSILVGLNVSGLLYMGGYNRKNMFSLKCDYCLMINRLIKYFMSCDNVQLLLLPHVFGRGQKSEGDTAAIDMIYSKLSAKDKLRIKTIEEGFDHHQLKFIIGTCDFFLGSRMHACIAAISQAVPTVGLSYSRKFRGVFESVDNEIPIADLRSLDYDQIVEIVDYAFTNRENLRNKLKTRMPNVVQDVFSFFQRVDLASSCSRSQ